MPLIKGKSDNAFSQNVRTEMEHGKPQKQALAIAYAMKRQAKAYGGAVKCAHGMIAGCPECHADGGVVKPSDDDNQNPVAKSLKSAFMAEGGEIQPYNEEGPESKMVHEEESSGYPQELLDRIMREHAMSEGGMIANDVEPMADSEPAQYDDLVLDDDLEEHYTDANSGDEIGNESEEDRKKKMVEMIMRSRAKKDRNPVPA